MKNKSILVLFSRKERKKTAYQRIFSVLKTTAESQNRAFDFTCSTLDELWIQVVKNKLVVTEPISNTSLDQYGFVEFNWWGRAKQQALATATYLQRQQVPFVANEIASMMADSKIGEMAVMADNDISLPATFMSGGAQIIAAFGSKPPITFPLIVKDADACGGKNNYLVHTFEQLVEVINGNPSIDFIVQEFIPNDCDYRCLVLGGEIRLVLKRSRGKSATTHVNNTSSGGEGEVVPLDSIEASAQAMVLRAARVLGREQFSGVDLIINNETGEPYILEVNQTPEIEEGAEPIHKMTALFDYIENEAR